MDVPHIPSESGTADDQPVVPPGSVADKGSNPADPVFPHATDPAHFAGWDLLSNLSVQFNPQLPGWHGPAVPNDLPELAEYAAKQLDTLTDDRIWGGVFDVGTYRTPSPRGNEARKQYAGYLIQNVHRWLEYHRASDSTCPAMAIHKTRFEAMAHLVELVRWLRTNAGKSVAPQGTQEPAIPEITTPPAGEAVDGPQARTPPPRSTEDLESARTTKQRRSTEKGEGVTDDQPLSRLLSVFTNGVVDEHIKQASTVLQDDNLTTNEKLVKIDRLIPFPATASAEQLGRLLGVTKQAVMKTGWWIRNRKGKKPARLAGGTMCTRNAPSDRNRTSQPRGTSKGYR